ncbi:Cytochrome P450 [Macleaya cordata]|uniref:Cytochrome P450 n=1 Tax=Macleaya cordata TaxID=56857 RepID=A0A200QE46_MACCD|nr:Cytochrome P450 [Macleaya cordata]
MPIIEEAILDIFSKQYTMSKSIGIADMGCSSGPNTLLVISYLMDTIYNRCWDLGRASPEFLVFLNDLPGNDFNTIFRSLQGFYDELRETKGDGFEPYCFVAGLPGTFYGRLFPGQTLHFVHSSYSLHWLSQVPRGIEKSNKGNIYLAKSSQPTVVEAYLKQFQSDFGVFLRSRSAEVVRGGGMVLTLLGRESEDPCSKDCCYIWELLAVALRDMVLQGLIDEEKFESFNLPHYKPSPKELKSVIESEGSFIVNRLETFEVNWDGEEDNAEDNTTIDKFRSSNNIANCVRAAMESFLVTHFGEEIIDELFRRYREILADCSVSRNETIHLSLVVSLRRSAALDMVKHITIDTIIDLYMTTTPQSLSIADLGCSSGPNTLSVIREIVLAIDGTSRKISRPTPEFKVSLNDLPSNDFNSIFTGLPDFYKELMNGEGLISKGDHLISPSSSSPLVFIGGVPGSFYGRLFPSNSLHFIHSSNSLHWLSRVPPGLYDEEEGKSINKGNIYICQSSPAMVSKAYSLQFQEDFSVFLRSRSEELISDGRMVLIFLGRKGRDHNDRGNAFLWELFTRSMALLVSQGKVAEEKLDSYDVHFYAPSRDEIEDEVKKQGSFTIDQFEMFETERSVGKLDGGASYGTAVARAVRAIQESMIRHHFGDGIFIDNLFDVYAKLLDEEIAKEDIRPIPPGCLGFPFIGETLQFLSAANNSTNGFYDFVLTRRLKYGNCFKTNIFGETHVFMLSSTESAKAVLSGDFVNFRKRYIRSIAELIGEQSLLLCASQEQHRLIRNRLTPDLISTSSMSSFIRHFDESLTKTLPNWEQRGTVVVFQDAMKITFNAVCKMLVSIESTDELETLGKEVGEVCEAMLAFPLRLPGTRFYKGLKARKAIMKKLKKVIDQRRRRHIAEEEEEEEEHSVPQDLLQTLLDGSPSDNDPHMLTITDTQIQDNILTLIIAGQVTTASAMTWMVKYLDENQELQDTLRDQQTKLAQNKAPHPGSSAPLTLEDLNEMSHASKVVKETLRMASIVPWLPRVALKDCEIEGFKIEKGWIVNIDARSIHLDPTVYHDPSRFHPSRFYDDQSMPYSFLAFGTGGRTCLGINLAKAMLIVFLHRLITTYRWKVIDSDTNLEKRALFSRLRSGCPIRVTPVKP